MQSFEMWSVLLVLVWLGLGSASERVGQWRREQLPAAPFIPVTNADLHGNVVSLKNMLVSYEHKLLFCPVQKSASTLWTQLVCRLTGDPHWYEPSWHKKLPTVRGKSREYIEEILNDPNWTKAIFLRDPTRRLLSSFQYCINDKGGHNAHYRKHMATVTKSLNTSWEAFYRAVADPKVRLQNLHWRPQGDFCGFKKFHQLYQFVGNMEHMAMQGRDLLQQLGLWEQYGANEWSLAKVIKTSKIRDKSKNRYNFKKPANYNQSDCMFCSNHSPHQSSYEEGGGVKSRKPKKKLAVSANNTTAANTTMKSKDISLSRYLTKDVWSTLRNSDFYAKDYQLFQDIKASPFRRELYLQYPPPSSAGLIRPDNTTKRHKK